ncbi:hypothetical protein MUC14_002758 [Vibrio parahaemolyticus]|nr:hypothetical protein [Vibrio parahaemolyticus]
MKNLVFKSITMLSFQDEKARKEIFHPRKNLVIGRNHTGKSSLFKTLYQTLGAKPGGKLAQWNPDTASVVEFEINGTIYLVTHQSGYRALFNSHRKLIGSSSNHKEWTTLFSRITGFNLTLSDKNGDIVKADPKCFFLPFYIDQDSSWTNSWATFTGLQQFKQPSKSVLEYFSGIKSQRYYELFAEKKSKDAERAEFDKEVVLLNKALDRIIDKNKSLGTKLNFENFKEEVKVFSEEVNSLNKLQEELRVELVRKKELVDSITNQIESSKHALASFEKDIRFLNNRETGSLTCPTCGAQHEDTFFDVLKYAEDARVLNELTAKLYNDLDEAKSDYNKINDVLLNTKSRYERLNRLIEISKDDLTFKDILNDLGNEKATSSLREQIRELQDKIDVLSSEVYNLEQGIKEVTNRKRSSQILKDFREKYSLARVKLNLPSVDTKKMQITSRPDISGSGGPRALLAYYSAVWSTSLCDTGFYFVPIVIDSPNQKAQDDINLPKVIDFIFNNLPKGSQIIIGSENDFEQPVDSRITLDKPYSLLLESKFIELKKDVEPLINEMYSDIQAKLEND